MEYDPSLVEVGRLDAKVDHVSRLTRVVALFFFFSDVQHLPIQELRRGFELYRRVYPVQDMLYPERIFQYFVCQL